MKKLLRDRVEQKYILDCLKIKIGQHLDLCEIIQTTIEQSCNFLKLDRLLVYQLDTSLDYHSLNISSTEAIDTVTYEARKNETVKSALNYQEEICFQQFKYSNKYHQGFSLVINDIKEASNLDSGLLFILEQLQVRAKIIVPINVKGKLWGLAIAHQCFVPRQWQNEEVQFLRQICEYLAIAIYQNQSYQKLQQQKVFLEKQVKTQAQQIKDALIAAQVANQSKHEFIGSMSHELRTPLTCVIGLSGTLLQWSLSKNTASISLEKQQQYLQLIQESGKHLLNLINNILEFSEVESGKYLLDIHQISLSKLAKNTLKILQPQAINKGIDLRLDLDILPETEADLFFADGVRLTEILLNLIDNGIKFTENGGSVTLRIWRKQGRVIFQIEDTGIGIAEPEIPLLFETFKQLEDYRRRTHGGTGLGLALSKQLIELHGGKIEVESEEGTGSIFTVYLPERNINIGRKQTVETAAFSTPTKHLTSHSANNIHLLQTPYPPSQIPTVASRTIVLVTEDDEHATFICQLLTAVGDRVVWLTDITMAIGQIELLQPAIAIIDRDMLETPIQNIGRKIQEKKAGKDLAIFLLCSQLTGDEWHNFTQYGINDYLLKSMTPTQTLNKIETPANKNYY